MNKYSILNQSGERIYLHLPDGIAWPEALERGRNLAKDLGMDGVLYFEYWHGGGLYSYNPGMITRHESFCAIDNTYDPSNHGFNAANFAHIQLFEHGYADARAKADHPEVTPR